MAAGIGKPSHILNWPASHSTHLDGRCVASSSAVVKVIICFTVKLLVTTGQISMADLLRRQNVRWQNVRWLGHAACKPHDVMVKQPLFAHYTTA